MGVTALSRLARAARPAEAPVAFGRAAHDWTGFLHDVGTACGRLEGTGGRCCALVCRDSYWFAVGLFGLLSAGARVMVLPNVQPGTLAMFSSEFDKLVGDDLAASLGPATVLGPGPGPAWDHELPAHRCQLGFFTSGSTGAPKCIWRSLAELEGEIHVLDSVWGASLAQAPVLATVPHHHVYGLTFSLLWPLAAGRPFSNTHHDLWEPLLAGIPSGAVVVSSPAHLSRLGGLAPVPVDRRPRLVLSAGAPLPAEAAADCRQVFGIVPTEIYGSTETGAIAFRRWDDINAAWQPLPGNQIAVSAAGCLAVKSPCFDGDRWIETADRVEVVDGGFHLRGRTDRVAKIEGKRIDLDAMTVCLRALPQVLEAIVLVLPTPTGDVLAVVVVPSDQGRDALDLAGPFRFGRMLRDLLAAAHDPACLPRRWRFVDRMPVDTMGKLKADALAALFRKDSS